MQQQRFQKTWHLLKYHLFDPPASQSHDLPKHPHTCLMVNMSKNNCPAFINHRSDSIKKPPTCCTTLFISSQAISNHSLLSMTHWKKKKISFMRGHYVFQLIVFFSSDESLFWRTQKETFYLNPIYTYQSLKLFKNSIRLSTPLHACLVLP